MIHIPLSGFYAGQTLPYYLAVGGAALHLSYQVMTLNLDDVADCWSKFVSNTRLGLLLFIGIVAGRLYAAETEKDEDSATALA